MRTFLDFQKEVTDGKIKNVYYIAAIDNYFIQKAAENLREKLFGNADNKENFFLKYADEIPMLELIDFARSSASLFSPKKLIIVKRCEKYSRKLSEFLELSLKTDEDSVIFYIFDSNFVIEKKLYDSPKYGFYDFSVLPQKELYEWVRSEFLTNDLKINNDALDLFITSIPPSFDLLSTEIEKISNYDFGTGNKLLTREIVLQFIGYDKDYSPEELISSILSKERLKAFKILNNLLDNKGVNEVYLLSVLSKYYLDLLSFKTAGLENMDNRLIYQKYKIWGEGIKLGKIYVKSMNIISLAKSIENLLETDKKLKSSMLDPKILMAYLVDELLNA